MNVLECFGCLFLLYSLFLVELNESVTNTQVTQYILSFALCTQKFAHGNF